MALFALSSLAIAPTLGADDALFLLSFWKPVVLLIPIAGWAWLVSNVLDKHAKRFFLETERWGMIHMIFGMAAFAAALAIPLANEGAFWAGFGAMIVILAADIGIYTVVVNRDERVPEAHHIGLNIAAQMAARKNAKQKAKSAGAVKLVIRDASKVLLHKPRPPSSRPVSPPKRSSSRPSIPGRPKSNCSPRARTTRISPPCSLTV